MFSMLNTNTYSACDLFKHVISSKCSWKSFNQWFKERWSGKKYKDTAGHTAAKKKKIVNPKCDTQSKRKKKLNTLNVLIYGGRLIDTIYFIWGFFPPFNSNWLQMKSQSSKNYLTSHKDKEICIWSCFQWPLKVKMLIHSNYMPIWTLKSIGHWSSLLSMLALRNSFRTLINGTWNDAEKGG